MSEARRRVGSNPRKPLQRLLSTMSHITTGLRDRVVGGADAKATDDFAQAIVCSYVVVQRQRNYLAAAASWLIAQAEPTMAAALREAFAANGLLSEECRWLSIDERFELAAASDAVAEQMLDVEHLYELFLAQHDRIVRRRHGVFYTPQPIVAFMVREIDCLLRVEFGRTQGLVTSSGDSPLSLLDPAAGAGAFLCGVVTQAHANFVASGAQADWSQYVVAQLLPALHGIELQPAACVLGQLNLAMRLAATSFDFSAPGKLQVRCGNALDEATAKQLAPAGTLVVLGNPPFSSLSENNSPWITKLVRGDGDDAGYLQIDGERLGERKTWLHDDYVKFLRLAQWMVDQAGSGVVALVTNHGYLDNATFRILRRQIARSLPRISVVDLHGNRKKGETAPSGEADENVFGLDQGVAIGFFRKTDSGLNEGAIEHAELWGLRDSKLRELDAWHAAAPASKFAKLTPSLPDYRWTPSPATSPAEYQLGVRLPEAMPVYTTAPVTARDGLVVAFTECELIKRIERFADLSIPDELVRRELFPRPRSARYPAGDTRSWKLTEVRRLLAAETNLQKFAQRCLYRPFDWRFVFWHPAMIDWPRNGVMRHLLCPESSASETTLALIARRQMLPTQPCNFFWVTDCLTLDGVIRSDNRGSEAVFPLAPNAARLFEPSEFGEGEAPAEPGAARAVEKLESPATAHRQTRLGGSLALPSHATRSVGTRALDWLHYAYALFHAPGYRSRYADELRRDFPRVLQPRTTELFEKLVEIGRRLIDLHLLRSPSLAPIDQAAESRREQNTHLRFARGYPTCSDGAVLLAPDAPLVECSETVWQFRVGGHQPARKWLADRNGRQLTPDDERHYRRMLTAIERSNGLSNQIEEIVASRGGWPNAFVS